MDTVLHHAFQTVLENIPKVFYALVILVALDYVTGVCVAVNEKKLSSKIGAKGIAGKVMVFIIVALSAIAGNLIFGDGTSLCTMTSLFYCTNEIFSILENAHRMGIPLPKRLTEVLKALRDNTK